MKLVSSLHGTFKSLILLDATLHPRFGALLQWQIPKDGPLKNERLANYYLPRTQGLRWHEE